MKTFRTASLLSLSLYAPVVFAGQPSSKDGAPSLAMNMREAAEPAFPESSVGATPDPRQDEADDDDNAKYKPRRNRLLLGAFGGIFAPSRELELFEPDPTIEGQGHKPFRAIGGEVGARLSYKILAALALELEGVMAPTKTREGQSAILWGAKAHALAQVPKWRVSPFALAGAGFTGVRSTKDVVGMDSDFAVHAGVGLDIGLRENLRMRLDVRDIITAASGVKDGFAQNLEANLGLSLAFDLSKPEPVVEAPKDSDGDGFLDKVDRCVHEPGVAPDGCPEPEPEPTVAPPPPPPDTDGDGILDADDSCVDEPESVNGFEDADGCPDELPKEVEKFSGVVKGIQFATGKSNIRSRSYRVLNEAVEIFKKYPSIRFEIQGHTDDRGSASYNQSLSQQRAESVRDYLIAHGVDESRITSRGFGPEQPVADNGTKSGRAQNRRIEFKIVEGEQVSSE